MLIKNCKDKIKVGDWVRTNGDYISQTGFFEGEIGEIDGKGFYVWQNKKDGVIGNIKPKGYKYSWYVDFNNEGEIEILRRKDMDYICIKGEKIELPKDFVREIEGRLKKDNLTPENIQFTEATDFLSMGLAFGDRQELYWNYTNNMFIVGKAYPSIKTKLIPIEKKDIEIGDWVFMSDNKEPDFSKKENYKLIIKDCIYKYISDNEDIETGYIGWKYYWKIVPVD